MNEKFELFLVTKPLFLICFYFLLRGGFSPVTTSTLPPPLRYFSLASSLLHIKLQWWLFSHVSPSFSSVCVLVAYSMHFPTGSAGGKKQPAMLHHSSRLLLQHEVTSFLSHKERKNKTVIEWVATSYLWSGSGEVYISACICKFKHGTVAAEGAHQTWSTIVSLSNPPHPHTHTHSMSFLLA